MFDVELPITKGQQIVVYSFSNKQPARITSLVNLINKENEVVKAKPKKLVQGNFAEVIIKMENRICLELITNNNAMGRIALRDGMETIAAGVITEFIS